jgi:uncharacterized alpha-E superfamily protein
LLKPVSHEVQVERAAAEVPSRVADELFWLGRYAERLEGLLRIVRCSLRHLSGEAGGEPGPERLTLIPLLVRLQLLPVRDGLSTEEAERELLSLVYKANRDQGVRSLVNRIRHIAATVRDRFSADTWRIFTELHSNSRTRPRRLPLMDALGLINTLITDLAAFSGLEMENMTRGHGWRFLDFGRRLERANGVARLVRAALAVDARGPFILESLLEIADSTMTYRRRYFTQVHLHAILHLLLLDAGNPRSLEFQLAALADHAANLPEDRAGRGAGHEARQVEAMRGRWNAVDVIGLAGSRAAGALEEIESALQQMEDDLAGLSDGLTQHYFSHTLTHVN